MIGSWVAMNSDAYRAKPLPRSEVTQDDSQCAGVFLCADRVQSGDISSTDLTNRTT
jgi:hypothetical protein